jgi:hypothetical protein
MRERPHARDRPALASLRRLGWAFALVASFATTPAAGYYEESHITGDEARVTIDTTGNARVEHVVLWHVVAGQYHFLDLPGLDTSARIEPEASLTAEDGRVYPATLVPREGNALRVAFEEPKGIRHGHYKVHVAYQVDLVATHAFARDGAMWRLTWNGPALSDGYDGARVTFVIPASVDEPRLADAAAWGDGADTGILSTLRRAPDRDELELVKPHVARHEVVAWSIRVAPRAFPAVRDPSLRPPMVQAPLRAPESGPPPLALVAAAFAAALVYAYLAHRKSAVFESACRAFGVGAEGLVGLRLDLRAALAGAAFGAGVLLQIARSPTLGGVGVAAAMLLAAQRPPRARVAARGPGKWLALRPEEAFPRRVRGDVFDPGSFQGAVALVGALAVLVALALALALRGNSTQGAYLVALDAFALLPLVATGRRSQLPPDARSGTRWLRRVFARLSKHKSLRVAPWARVPVGCTEPDEVRVLVVPRVAMPGLVGIEVGLSWRRSATSYASVPGVLVRVHGISAASARMTTLAPFARPVPGRHPEERVFRLGPRLPTRDGTLRLVQRLARELEDRRTAGGAWREAERRVPPEERERAVAAAA